MGQLGEGVFWRWGIPSDSWVCLLLQSVKLTIGSMAHYWILSAGCCESPLLFPAPKLFHLPQYSGWGKKEVDFLLGKPWVHSLCFHSPLWEKLCWRDLSWHWAVLPWGRGDVGQVKLCFLPSSVCLFLDFFCSIGVLELLWTPGLPQRYSYAGVIMKIYTSVRREW